MNSYLSDRKQRVKLGNIVSQWKNIIKGVPQGSILGPLVFNIYINDIFFFLEKVKMYNYADDNTESYAHRKAEVMKSTVESETVIYLAIQSQKRCLFFVLLAFLSTLFYLCLYYSLTCAKPHRGGCQVCKCFWASEIGQRSTKCKILKTFI